MPNPTKQFTTRPATIDDVPALAAVHLESWLATYRGIIADDYLDALDRATFEGYHRPRFAGEGQRNDPNMPFVVACDGAGEMIGFARGGPTRTTSPTGDPLPGNPQQRFSAELYAIYLLPRYLGCGVGRAMFHQVVRELIELKHRSMCVWVLGTNPLGRRFYERMGGTLLPGESIITLGTAGYPHIAYGWDDIRAAAGASAASGSAVRASASGAAN
jgi:ribosomal protein S18 acetylase RimI-like enzyme